MCRLYDQFFGGKCIDFKKKSEIANKQKKGLRPIRLSEAVFRVSTRQSAY